MREVLFGAGSLVLLAVMGSFAGGEIVFAPLRRAQRAIGGALRFSLADFSVLAFHLQLAAGAILVAVPSDQLAFRLILIGCAWTVAFSWWLHGLSLLAAAGAEKVPHRMLFLCAVGPLGYLGAVMLPPLMLALITLGFICLIAILTSFEAPGMWPLLAANAFLAMLFLSAAIAARAVSRWLMQDAARSAAAAGSAA
jgi:hypothetical protein